MELTRYLSALRRGWKWIVALSICGALIGYAYSTTQPSQYRSTAAVFFQVTGANNAGSLLQGSNFAQSQVRSYAALATQPLVLDPVIDELQLDQSAATLARDIEATIPLDTVIVEISATAGDADEARAIADSVRRAREHGGGLVEARLRSHGEGDGERRDRGHADCCDLSLQPQPQARHGPGHTGGLRPRVRPCPGAGTREQPGLRRGSPVRRDRPPASGQRAEHRIEASPEPAGPGHQSHPAGVLPTCCGQLGLHQSLRRGEGPGRDVSQRWRGQDSLSANLAHALSESRRVLLLDGDLRNSNLADRLGLEASLGLTTVLTGKATLNDVIQRSGRLLDVVTCGEVPPNPIAMIGSDAFADLLAEARGSYDMVVVDGAPLLPVTDSALLAKVADGALLAVNSSRTTRTR